MMGKRTMEDLDTDETDFHQLLDELTDAKNHPAQHNGHLSRQWVLGSCLVFLATFLRTVQICHSWSLRARSGKQSEYRHKCPMAAIEEEEANTKIRKSLIGRSRPMRGDCVAGDAVHYWRAGHGVHPSQAHWMGPARVLGVEGSNRDKKTDLAEESSATATTDHRTTDETATSASSATS